MRWWCEGRESFNIYYTKLALVMPTERKEKTKMKRNIEIK